MGVVKRYRLASGDVTALAGIDLVARESEFVAVTGASGSGKTTLLNCLSGLDGFDEGSVTVDGFDIASLSEAQRTERRAVSMGFVFQRPNLLPAFNVVENVALPLILLGAAPGEARQKACSLLERVGLGGRLGHLPDQLSQGEQQRVAIARAFVKKPRIVWADEPTGNLDSRTASIIWGLLGELQGEGTTFILVTHDVALAERADRRVEVHDGRIVMPADERT